MSSYLAIGGAVLLTSMGATPPGAHVAEAHLPAAKTLRTTAGLDPTRLSQASETPTAQELAELVRSRYASLDYLEFHSVGSFEIVGSTACERVDEGEAETHRVYPPSEAHVQMSPTSVRLHLRYNQGESESIVMVHGGRAAEVTSRFAEGSFDRLNRTLEEDEYLWNTYADSAHILYQQVSDCGHMDIEADFRSGVSERTFYSAAGHTDPSAPLTFEPGPAIMWFTPSGPAGASDWFLFQVPGCNFGAQLQTWIGPHCSIGMLFDQIAEADGVTETWRDGRRFYRVTHSRQRVGVEKPVISEFDIDAESRLLVGWRQERPQITGLTIVMGSEFSDHRTAPPEEGVVWMIEHEPGELLQVPAWRE